MRQFQSLNTLIMAECEKHISTSGLTQHMAYFTFNSVSGWESRLRWGPQW